MRRLILVPLTLLFACASTPPPKAAEPIGLSGKAAKLEGTRYLEYRVGTTIDAPPDKVWGLLTTADQYPTWNSTIVKIEGEIRKDAEIELTAKIDPDRTFELEVSTFEPNEKLVWQDGGSSFKGVRTFTLTSTGGPTQVTMSEVFTGWMLPMIEGSLPDFTESFETFVADLKKTAEKQ